MRSLLYQDFGELRETIDSAFTKLEQLEEEGRRQGRNTRWSGLCSVQSELQTLKSAVCNLQTAVCGVQCAVLSVHCAV